MAKKPLPTPEELRQRLTYDPETGQLTWRPRPVPNGTGAKSVKMWNGQYAGKPALACLDKQNRYRGAVNGSYVLAHRVAWAIVHGRWPDGEIDHIDGNPLNNKMSNLRDVPHDVNMRNLRVRSDNKSGVMGVFAHKRKWWAFINIRGTRHTIGRYDSRSDAIAARKAAEERLGFHPNHGRAPG